MLKTPEERVKNMTLPSVIQDRQRSRRLTLKRKSRWASKFKGLLFGKLQKRWKAKSQTELEQESRGVAKTKLKGRPSTRATTLKLKRQASLDAKSSSKGPKSSNKEQFKPCTESPWHQKKILVTED